ncbi:hypothetical protein VTH06DRAFT_5152 [Thermothelomyces fergusii]
MHDMTIPITCPENVPDEPDPRRLLCEENAGDGAVSDRYTPTDGSVEHSGGSTKIGASAWRPAAGTPSAVLSHTDRGVEGGGWVAGRGRLRFASS